jgi:ribonuclease VapC
LARASVLPGLRGHGTVESYLALMKIDIIPAQLNFGDCFAYACARHLGQPLLYKGADFPQTDIEAA